MKFILFHSLQSHDSYLKNVRKNVSISLQKKCPFSELFWCAFPAFGLNTKRCSVSLLIQSECRKMRIRITLNTDTFYAVFSSKILLIIFENNLRKYLQISIVKVHTFMKNDKYCFSF